MSVNAHHTTHFYIAFEFYYSLPTRVVAIQEGVLTKFCILIKIFCFQTNLDQTWSDYTHDWTENKFFLSVCKNLAGPLLKFQQL